MNATAMTPSAVILAQISTIFDREECDAALYEAVGEADGALFDALRNYQEGAASEGKTPVNLLALFDKWEVLEGEYSDGLDGLLNEAVPICNQVLRGLGEIDTAKVGALLHKVRKARDEADSARRKLWLACKDAGQEEIAALCKASDECNIAAYAPQRAVLHAMQCLILDLRAWGFCAPEPSRLHRMAQA